VVPETAQLAVQAAQPSAGRFRQLVVPIHRELHPKYGLVEITADDIGRYVANWHAGVKLYPGPPEAPDRRRSPVEIRHDDDRGSAGWIYSVWQAPDGLWAEGEYTPMGVQAIVDQEFPFISPNLWPEWTDSVTQQTYEDVFDGFSLEVRPQFRTLPPATVQHYREDPAPTVIVVGHPDAKERSMTDEQAAETTAEVVEQATDPTDPAEQTDPIAGAGEGAGDETDEQVVEVVVPPEKLGFGEENDPAELLQFSEHLAAKERDLAEREQRLAQDRQAFAGEARDQVRLQFSERAGALKFGEHRLTPAGRDTLAELAADIHAVDPALAQRFGEALGGLQTYLEGEVGLDRVKPLQPTQRAASRPAAADPEMQKFAETHGIDDETMRQAQESTTWRR